MTLVVSSLKCENTALKREIQQLKLASNESTRNSLEGSTLLNQETMVAELRQREVRKKNIMLYGVIEPVGSNPNEKLDADVKIAKEIFDSSITFTSAKPIRLGSGSTKVCRPIKIKLEDESLVHTILRNVQKIRNNENFSSVNVSSDRTPSQINYYKFLKKDLANRTNSGEQNLSIKYVDGIPTIVEGSLRRKNARPTATFSATSGASSATLSNSKNTHSNLSLCIYYQNVRSLRGKCSELFIATYVTHYDIILLTETWLSESIVNSELLCTNYNILRCDRDH